jgi:chromosome segregation ATPase
MLFQEIQQEIQELQGKIKELNETNKKMFNAEGVDRQEFSDIQTELRQFRSRWSTLIQQNNKENKRYAMFKC